MSTRVPDPTNDPRLVRLRRARQAALAGLLLIDPFLTLSMNPKLNPDHSELMEAWQECVKVMRKLFKNGPNDTIPEGRRDIQNARKDIVAASLGEISDCGVTAENAHLAAWIIAEQVMEALKAGAGIEEPGASCVLDATIAALRRLPPFETAKLETLVRREYNKSVQRIEEMLTRTALAPQHTRNPTSKPPNPASETTGRVEALTEIATGADSRPDANSASAEEDQPDNSPEAILARAAERHQRMQEQHQRLTVSVENDNRLTQALANLRGCKRAFPTTPAESAKYPGNLAEDVAAYHRELASRVVELAQLYVEFGVAGFLDKLPIEGWAYGETDKDTARYAAQIYKAASMGNADRVEELIRRADDGKKLGLAMFLGTWLRDNIPEIVAWEAREEDKRKAGAYPITRVDTNSCYHKPIILPMKTPRQSPEEFRKEQLKCYLASTEQTREFLAEQNPSYTLATEAVYKVDAFSRDLGWTQEPLPAGRRFSPADAMKLVEELRGKILAEIRREAELATLNATLSVWDAEKLKLEAPSGTPSPFREVYEAVADAVHHAWEARYPSANDIEVDYAGSIARPLAVAIEAASKILNLAKVRLIAIAPDAWDAYQDALEEARRVNHACGPIVRAATQEVLTNKTLTPYLAAQPPFDAYALMRRMEEETCRVTHRLLVEAEQVKKPPSELTGGSEPTKEPGSEETGAVSTSLPPDPTAGPAQTATGSNPVEPIHPDGPEQPHWLWLQGKRYRIGKPRSTRSWQLLAFFWDRESATYDELVGYGNPWVDPVTDSAFATAVNRFNIEMPANLPWKLTTKGRCVTKESRENPAK